jgi:hypothetical protein
VLNGGGMGALAAAAIQHRQSQQNVIARTSSPTNLPPPTAAAATTPPSSSGPLKLIVKIPHCGFMSLQTVQPGETAGALRARVLATMPPDAALNGAYTVYVNSQQSAPLNDATPLATAAHADDTIIYVKDGAPMIPPPRQGSTRFQPRLAPAARKPAAAAAAAPLGRSATPASLLPPPVGARQPTASVATAAAASSDDAGGDDMWSQFDADQTNEADLGDFDLSELDFDVDKMLEDAGVSGMMADLDADLNADEDPFAWGYVMCFLVQSCLQFVF